MTMHNSIEKVLFTEVQIQERITELAAELSDYYEDKSPLVVTVLKGGVPFFADLVMQMDILLEMEFMAVSSYGDAFSSSGEVNIQKDIGVSAEGRHVLFVEDIIDTGATLNYLFNMFKNRGAASVKAVTLLDKPANRQVDLEADWVGFEAPDEFVVGYGLDFKNFYRNLPYIGVMKEEVYS